MKRTAETPERLVFEDRPMALAIGLGLAALAAFAYGVAGLFGRGDGAGPGFFALMMCLSAFAAFVRRQTLSLDRATGQAVLRVVSVFGQKASAVPLAEVRAVEVETRPGKRRRGKGDAATHRAVLRLAGGGSFALGEVFTSGPGAAELGATVARWLGLPAPTA